MDIFNKRGRLYCFTPEVALATFITEIILAIYAFIKHRSSRAGLLSFFMLIFLSAFQLSEFLICSGLDDKFWSMIGVISITVLPPLGLFMVAIITGKNFWAKAYSYTGTVLILMFIFASSKFVDNATCTGNYIIFRSFNEQMLNFYRIFYYSGLSLAILEMLDGLRKHQNDILKKKYLGWFIFGYLSFMLPTLIVILIPSFSLQSLPSVLCGFAIIFAFVLTFKIVPIARKLNI